MEKVVGNGEIFKQVEDLHDFSRQALAALMESIGLFKACIDMTHHWHIGALQELTN